jgi:acyl carrier protein
MRVITPEDAKTFLEQHLSRKLGANGRGKVDDLADDCDLLLSGMIDSIGLLDLVGAIQEFVGMEIDFDTLDPEQMTTVGPLCRFISDQSGKRV